MSEMNGAQVLRDLSDLQQQLADVTGLSKSVIQAEIAQLDYRTFQFKGATLVAPTDFVGIVDSWSEKLKADLRNLSPGSRSKSSRHAKAETSAMTEDVNGKKKQNSTPPPSTVAPPSVSLPQDTQGQVFRPKGSSATRVSPKPQVIKPASTELSESLPTYTGSFKLPKNYQSMVSHLYGPSLQRLMPQGNVVEQKAFLEAIAHESAEGVELLQHLSAIIAIKLGNRMNETKVYQGLKNKAAKLLEQPIVPRVKELPKRRRRRKSSSLKIAPLGVQTVEAKPSQDVEIIEMELPKGYRKHVSNRYGPTLLSILPKDVALKQAYLKEIVAETNWGKSYLKRVADSIKIKYRGRITSNTAYQGLLEKARAM